MADRMDPIQIPVIIDDSTIAPQMRAVGNVVEAESNRGTLGAKGMNIAFKSLGHQIGLTGAISRTFGHEVADLTMMLGAGAGALGLLTVAGIATYKVYEHFAGSAEKLQAEQIKAAEGSMKWVDAARIERSATGDLRDYKEALWKSERDRAKWNLEQGLKAESDAINKASDELRKLKMRAEMDPSGGSLLGYLVYGSHEKRQREFEQAQLDYNDQINKIKGMMMDLSDIKSGNVMSKDSQKGIEDYNSSLREARNQQFDNLVANEERERKLRVQNWSETQAMLGRRSKAYEQDAANHKRAEMQKWENSRQISGNIAQMADIMSSMGGRNARKWFILAKEAATAEAIINTYQGATKALAQGGVMGPAMAASIIALGMANVMKIQSQEFGGGGAGAVGTYSASPVTGLPSGGSGTAAPPTVIIYVDGKQANIPGLAKETLQYVYDQHGNVGGFNLKVERSA